MPSLQRGLSVLFTVLALCIACPQGFAAQPMDEGYPDLAPFVDNVPAMTLTASEWDLRGVDLERQLSFFIAPEEYAIEVSNAGNGDVDDVLAEWDAIGFQGLYASRMSAGYLNDDPADNLTAFSLIAAFDDADGAEAFLSSGLPYPGEISHEDKPDLGDAARYAVIENEDEESLPQRSQVLQIQRDHLVGNIFILYASGSSDDLVDADVVLEHGGRLLDRIDAELDEPTPALFRSVLRPAMDEVIPPTSFNDGYYAIDGEFTDYLGFDDVSIDYWADYVVDNRIDAEYSMRAWAIDPDQDIEIGFFFTTVTQFADVDAADGWLEDTDGGQWTLDENGDLETLDNLPKGVAGFRADYDYPDMPEWHVITLMATDGNLGTTLILASEREADLADVLELVDMQVDCLDLAGDELCDPVDIGDYFA